MKRKNLILLLLILIASVLIINPHEYIGQLLGVLPREKTTHNVIHVIDGDTIVVDINGVEEKVRLIGVDTPELNSTDDTIASFAKTAADFTAQKLNNRQILIELDTQERDRYQRVLAYVYLQGVMFNKILLREGLAQVATYPPNVTYADDFVELQRKAVENQVGLWSQTTPISSAIQTSPYPDRLIKGNINTQGKKIYHLPGKGSYDDTVIDESQGEKWFATEEEAKAAGWQKAGNSE